MQQITRFLGLDVHAKTIAAAIASGDGVEVNFVGTFPNHPDGIRRLIKKVGGAEGILACYEAGPTGYALHRELKTLGVRCEVIAPSLIPVKAGERVKTDRLDAEKLARNLRAGLLTTVYVPTPEHEAFRDLVRAREAAKQDQLRARHRVQKFLLRYHIRPPAKVKAWTSKHMDWLNQLEFEFLAQNAAFVDLRNELHRQTERVTQLEAALIEAIETLPEQMHQVLKALQGMRGVAVITAATIVAEVGAFSRFKTASELMAYAGIVPSEHSSGQRTLRLGITKSGNARIRRVIVESAWNYRFQPAVTEVIRRRQEGLPPEVKAIAWKAQQRLSKRHRHLLGKGKLRQQVVTAVGRELLGFIWEIGCHVENEFNQLKASKAA